MTNDERVLEFLTDLSKASEYKSHDLGFEDSISNQWKTDAADLLVELKQQSVAQRVSSKERT